MSALIQTINNDHLSTNIYNQTMQRLRAVQSS